jgi:hypothetical protein
MTTTRIILILIAVAGLFCGGCTLVPTDMFPKPAWAWSADAKAYRQQKKADESWRENYDKTNAANYFQHQKEGTLPQ